MSDDTEFDDGFVHGVRTALRTGVADVPAPTALLPMLRKQYGHRVARRRVGVAMVPLAVAVVAGAGVVILPNIGTSGPSTGLSAAPSAGLSPNPSPGPDPRPNPRIEDVAYVAEQVSNALGNPNNAVVATTAVETGEGKYSRPGKPATYHNWIAADGQSFRSQVLVDGQPVYDNSLNPEGGAAVDYRTRTWHPTPGFGRGDGKWLTDVLTPDEIKTAMASGHLQIVAEGEVINGQRTVQLRGDDKVIPLTGPVQFWVNEATWLPIRYQNQQTPDDSWGNTTEFTWLPPTPENLALLKTPVPPGFARDR
jgi:hypothetical protein